MPEIVPSPNSETVSTPLARCVDGLIRARWWLLGLALLATVAAWPLSRQLTFDQSIESLYADDDPHLRDFLGSRSTFGGDEFLIVAWPEPDLFQPDSDALTDAANTRIYEFGDQLNEVPGVAAESTQHLASALRFPYRRDRVRQIVRGLLLGSDDTTTAVILRLMPEKESSVSRRETIARVRQLALAHQPPAMVVGEPAQVHDMFRYVEDDGRTLFVVSLILLGFVLLVLQQRLRWVLLPLVVVVISLTWTEAVLVLSGLRLSMVSSMLNSLMTIISVQTGMHVSLYFRDQHRELPPVAALRRSMIELASPVWWSIATTAFGFGVLLSSHISPVASFGLMMAVGSLVVFVAVVVLLPGCVLLGRMLPETPPSAADRHVAASLGRITLWVEHHPRRVAIGSLLLVAFALAGFPRLRIETDFSKNFREKSQIVQSLQYVESKLGGAGSWEVNFPAPQKLNAEYIERVRGFAARLQKDFGFSEAETQGSSTDTAGRLSKVIVMTDGLDLIPNEIPFFGAISLERRLQLLGNFHSDFINGLFNSDKQRMRILLRAYERQPSEAKLQLIADVERLARETFGDAQSRDIANAPSTPQLPSQSPGQSTGLFVLLAFLIESLMADQWTSFFLSSFGITGMMWLAFRSFPIALMSLIPNLFPNILVIGLMGWMGLPVNIATAMIACVSMGLTVDASIIYIDGYRRARSSGLRVHAALHETHRGVGRALVYSTVALMAGFSVLSLSHFIPLVYFGLLVSLAMLGGLIGNLVFLPLLLGWWDARGEG